MTYPLVRLRRNRKAKWSRDLVAENTLMPSDLVLPMFVVEGTNVKEAIKTLPDVFRLSIDNAIKQAEEALSLGIKMIALFPVLDSSLKNDLGSEALNPENLICRAIKAIKEHVPGIGVMVDVALDPYTTHGHDGVLNVLDDVDNDKTVEILVQQALILAQSGADAVAPSDMMDGRILEIRTALENLGLHNTQIISYSVKYASSFYGPFRDAVKSSRTDGSYIDKGTYQMDFRNEKEACREVNEDICEGADMIIIKPGMPYLDIIKGVSEQFEIPILAYQVSGEYAALKFASLNGALDFDKAMLESLMAFKRAGCCAVITYAAIAVAKLLSCKE